MIRDDDPRHGTPAGYQQCRKRPQRACLHCRWASALHQELWRWDREGEAAATRRHQVQSRRQRALTILAQRHPAELETIIASLGGPEPVPRGRPRGTRTPPQPPNPGTHHTPSGADTAHR